MKLTRPCTPEECFQLSILALAETAGNILLDRSKPKSRRYNRVQAMMEQIEAVNETFDGYLPDTWIAHSMKFNTTLEASMTALLKTFKYERANP